MKLPKNFRTQIINTKKDFLIYLLNSSNEVVDLMLTNDLTRYRKRFGINSKFILTDVIKKQIKTKTI